jgi:hypothetical protein
MSTITPARTRLRITQKGRDLVRTAATLGALVVIGIIGAGASYGVLIAIFIFAKVAGA